MGECYIRQSRSINLINRKDIFIWDTQRNIEEEEKWVLKREELEKETNENKNYITSGKNCSNKKCKRLDFRPTRYSVEFVFIHFNKSSFTGKYDLCC